MARVLGVIRLSRDKDDSTSRARQRQYVTTWAAQNGHEVVGWAEDLDVSGSVAPWQRPGLGPWLPSTMGAGQVSAEAQRRAWDKSRAGEFDVLACWRLDRVSRRVLHLAGLIEWCQANGKEIHSTSEGFDMNSPMGRVFVQILGALAEGELEAIKDRARSSFSHLMRQGRWRGGAVPYGYVQARNEKGGGWRLEIDPESSRILREIVSRVIGGESANSVNRWLNETGTLSPKDMQRVRAGKEPHGVEWRVGNLIKLLHSHTLLGHAEMTETIKTPTGNQKVTRIVRDEDGMPLQRAEPIIDPDEFARLQEALSANSNKKAGNRRGGSPLLRVAFCECGEPMYRKRGRSDWYYQCGRRNRAGVECETNPKSIRADELESVIEGSFLALVGHLPIVRRTLVRGVNHTAETEDIQRAMQELMNDRAAGLFSSESGTATFRAMFQRLEARASALGSLSGTADEWVEEQTGETYAERWAALGTAQERGRELRASGVRAIVHAIATSTPSLFGTKDGELLGSRVTVEIPNDLREQVLTHATEDRG